MSEWLHGFAAAAFLVLPLYGLLAARGQVGNFMLFGALAFIACPSVYPEHSGVYRFGLWLLPVLGIGSIWTGLAFEPRQMSRVFLGFSFFLAGIRQLARRAGLATGKPSWRVSGSACLDRLVGCVALVRGAPRRCDSAVALGAGRRSAQPGNFGLHTACRFS